MLKEKSKYHVFPDQVSSKCGSQIAGNLETYARVGLGPKRGAVARLRAH